MARSPYDVLGVSTNADPVVIEAAYKALMRRFHPDRPSGDAAKAAEINTAYSLLRDPILRKRFDQEGAATRRTTPMPPPGSFMGHYDAPPKVRFRSAGLVFVGLAALTLVAAAILLQRSPVHAPPAPFEQVEAEEPKQHNQATIASRLPPADMGEQPIRPLLIQKALAQYEEVVAKHGPEGALSFSAYCFDAQRRTRSFNDFVFCAAFDNFVSAASAAGLSDGARQYFSEQQVLRRQIVAAELFSTDGSWIQKTLEKIWSLSVNARLDPPAVELPPDLPEPSVDTDVSPVRAPAQAQDPAIALQWQAERERPTLGSTRQAATAAAERWAACVARQYATKITSTQRAGALDSAFASCAGPEMMTRQTLQSAIDARGPDVSPQEVERNMDAVRSAIRRAIGQS